MSRTGVSQGDTADSLLARPSHPPPSDLDDACNLLLCQHLQHCAPGLLHSDNNTRLTIWLQTTLVGARFAQKCDNRTSGSHTPSFEIPWLPHTKR